jgi:glycosyl hydrolase family 79
MSPLSRPGRYLLAGALTILAASVSVYASTIAQAATAVKITVSAGANGHVGTGFAGFSYEKDRIGAGMFDAHDTKLVNLFRRLGPSVLRLGGNLVDMTSWNAKGTGGSASEIAPADVQKLAAFLQATGWKAIYGINLKTNTAANAASEAAFAAKALGANLIAFEIGNEPNVYKSESTYETSFASYVKAIRAKVPGAHFDGPGTYGHTDWMSPFAAHEKSNGLQILSMHTYVGNNTNASISGLLASTQPGGKFPGQFAAMQNAKDGNGIPQWRMTEANSYFHGGTDGVSNVEAAALWSLDFMYGIASHDGDGVNFHGGTSTQFPLHYSPIRFSGLIPVGVQAVYYGELLWSLAGTGSLHPATVSGGSGIAAWGIGGNVIVNNKGSAAITATVTLTGTATTAKVYLLTAPSLSSKSITVAGSTVSSSGAFTPVPKSVTVSGGKVVVSVPAGSAALVLTQ